MSSANRANSTIDVHSDTLPVPTSTRFLLRSIIYQEELAAVQDSRDSLEQLASWLASQGLASLAYVRCKRSWPELAEYLRASYFITAANNSLHLKRLEAISSTFAAAEIPVVLLKGAALSQQIYTDPGLRPMSDIDLWVRAQDMPAASKAMVNAGFVEKTKLDRPIDLQRLAGGERAFASPDHGLVELHWAPFSGWWAHYTARVDHEGIWKRLESIKPLSVAPATTLKLPRNTISTSWQTLSAEDTLLHLAWHLAVNHQFGMWPVRSLVDVLTLVRTRPIDWQVIIVRAYQWRLATVLWSVLQFADQIIGNPEIAPALNALAPSYLRRRLLARYVPPQTLIAGVDLSVRLTRYLVLLLLADRFQDSTVLAFRTLWPEKSWLQARYGEEKVNNWRHLWRILRYREI